MAYLLGVYGVIVVAGLVLAVLLTGVFLAASAAQSLLSGHLARIKSHWSMRG
jgi:hypothetical protein